MKQDEFTRSLRKIMRAYGDEYATIADRLTKSILRYMENGDTIARAYRKAMQEVDFYTLNAEAIEDAVYEAALKGYGINAEPLFVGVDGEGILRHKLMDVSWAADKMKLSTRLHGVDNVLHNNIKMTVGNALKSYKTIQQLSMELYDGYNTPENILKPATLSKNLKKVQELTIKLYSGDKEAAKSSAIFRAAKRDAAKIKTPGMRAAYQQVLDAATSDKKRALQKARKMLELGGSKQEILEMLAQERDVAVKKALWVAVQEKTRYYAERIARTESARAYYEGQMTAAAKDDDVFGFQWVLSPAHGHTIGCDCEAYAKIDIGYGRGVFPKDQVPFLPAHPNCMCHLRKVFVWEVVRTGGKDEMPKQPRARNRVSEAVQEVLNL